MAAVFFSTFFVLATSSCCFQLFSFLLSSQVMIAHMDLGRASGSAITIRNEYVLAQLQGCANRKGCKSAHRNWKATAALMTTYMCGHRTSQLLLLGMRCFALIPTRFLEVCCSCCDCELCQPNKGF